MMRSDNAARRIRNRLHKIIRESDQIVIDIEWWNSNRTDEGPLDCEDMRILSRLARKCLAAFDAGRDKEFAIANDELQQYAKSILPAG